jgi:hypothetical protein
MSNEAFGDHESIATRTPDRYTHHGESHRPEWTHDNTGLVVRLVREDRVPEGRMDATTARTPDDKLWRLVVRSDDPPARADVYRLLGGRRDAAVETALQWLADHPNGSLDE